MSNLTLRPFLPRDLSVLAAIFQDSVETLTEEDYNVDQRAAWVAVADDEEAFAERLSKSLTLIVEAEGAPAGFAAMEDNKTIAMLYVHPRHARQGIATILCDALEKLAAARGSKLISADSSDTALPFFDGRGYVAVKRNTVILDGQWLGNTTMQKTLDGPRPEGRLS